MANIDKQLSGQEQENGSDRFQSDAEKLANKHMADPNHVITDEEFAKVRVGMTPPPDAPTKEAIKDGEDRIVDHKSDKEDDTIPGGQKVTPWDVVK